MTVKYMQIHFLQRPVGYILNWEKVLKFRGAPSYVKAICDHNAETLQIIDSNMALQLLNINVTCIIARGYGRSEKDSRS